jgi:hypothetical protein
MVSEAPSLIHGGEPQFCGAKGRREASVLVGKPVGRWSLTKSLLNHLGSRRGWLGLCPLPETALCVVDLTRSDGGRGLVGVSLGVSKLVCSGVGRLRVRLGGRFFVATPVVSRLTHPAVLGRSAMFLA